MLSMTIAFLLGISAAQSQEKQERKAPVNGPRDRQAQFYRRSLGVDSAKASAVAGIQSAYKSGMAVLLRDSSLTDDGRRARVRELMEAKNSELRKILSPAQQEKVIPTTERTGQRGTQSQKP